MSAVETQNQRPLSDLRVLDLTVARAGPTAVRQLADWGADTIRVDAPPGVSAVAAHHRDGSDFQNLHRNKRSIVLDLKQPRGRGVLLRLVETADVLVENYRPVVKEHLGFSYDVLAAVNPRLIMASISGFGQTGPYRDRAGVDQTAQGMAGMMSVTGLPGQGPVRAGTAISDLAAGLYLAFGVLAAVHERRRSGRGQWLHTSLLEAQLGILDFQVARHLRDGDVPSQEGNHHPTLAPMGLFETADGHVNVAASSDRHFERLCRELELDDLLTDERFADPPSRFEHRVALRETLTKRLRSESTAHWVARLNDLGIPCGPVNDIEQAVRDPQVEHLGMIQAVEHPRLGGLRIVGQPLHFERTPSGGARAAPDAGEHTREVLSGAGLDEEQIEELLRGGVVHESES